MGKAWVHKVLMYVTEGMAIATIAMWCLSGRLEYLLFTIILAIVSATFHVTYLLSELYEKIDKYLSRCRRGCDS